MNLLTKYPQDTIDFVEDFINETEDLDVYEFIKDDFVQVPNDEMIEGIKLWYLTAGVGEGYFDTVEEFDEIYSELLETHKLRLNR